MKSLILLQAANISKSYGANQVLNGVSITIKAGDRAGIVGVNGAGKSTLLKILTGIITPDEGEVFRSRDTSMAFLAQGGGLDSEKTIWDEMLSVFTPLIQMETRLREIERQMGEKSKVTGDESYNRLLLEYDSLTATFKNLGGFEYEANIRGVLHGLKFNDMDYNTPVTSLSGGQKTRLALARCLLAAPGLLILDEPTNYLDMDNMSWLEQYLQSYRGTVLTVSHDRYFLDAIMKVIYELSRGKIYRYPGNYSSFISQKEEATEQQIKDYNRQQSEIARMEDFIRRNMAAKDTVGRARSRQKALDKIDRVERPAQERRVAVSFAINRASGQEVLQVSGLAIGYSGSILASDLNFGISRGERVALLGPNGIGKSTLLKTIAGKIHPISGHIQFGSFVQTGYYEQEQQGLHHEKQVLDELWDRFPNLDEVDIRTVLGRFLFRGDDAYKLVADLSGGERSRLALASLMLQKANFLVMDEPTNHLDLASKEALEEALKDYPGTILFVSHDRYFINKIAGRVLNLDPGGINSYPGNYDYYLSKKVVKQNQITPRTGETLKQYEKELYLQRKEEERQRRKHQRQVEELEQNIAILEKSAERLEKELYLPEVYQDYEACSSRQAELEKIRNEHQLLLEKWLSLIEND